MPTELILLFFAFVLFLYFVTRQLNKVRLNQKREELARVLIKEIQRQKKLDELYGRKSPWES